MRREVRNADNGWQDIGQVNFVRRRTPESHVRPFAVVPRDDEFDLTAEMATP